MDIAVLGATPTGRSIAGRCGLAGHTAGLRNGDANVVMDAIDAVERGRSGETVTGVDGTTDPETAVDDVGDVGASHGGERDRRGPADHRGPDHR